MTKKIKRRPQPPRVRSVSAPVPPIRSTEETKPAWRILTKQDVLDRTGTSYPTVWKWMREGTFPLSRVVGDRVGWIEAEVDAWIKARPVSKYKAMEGA